MFRLTDGATRILPQFLSFYLTLTSIHARAHADRHCEWESACGGVPKRIGALKISGHIRVRTPAACMAGEYLSIALCPLGIIAGHPFGPNAARFYGAEPSSLKKGPIVSSPLWLIRTMFNSLILLEFVLSPHPPPHPTSRFREMSLPSSVFESSSVYLCPLRSSTFTLSSASQTQGTLILSYVVAV